MKYLKKYWHFLALLFLLFLAGAANGFMDALQFHGAWQNFEAVEFWNPDKSWKNKWAKDSEGLVLVGTEKFWGSSRWFVAITDAWHLLKFFQLFFLKMAVLLALFAPRPNWKWWEWALAFGAVTMAMSAGFHLLYSLIF